MAKRRLKIWLATVVTLAAGACGADRTGGPRGEPEAVVRQAPDKTLAAGSAVVEVSAPDAQSRGRLEFGGLSSELVARGPGQSKGYPELSDPLALVELVRGAVAVESYGGAAIRGVSTFRYEVVVNIERAVAQVSAVRRPELAGFADRLQGRDFYADVWVDGAGRLRRVQVPVLKTTVRPAAHVRNLPALISVDLFDYQGGD